jgi:sporulation protein YlmC with PRC-barrel domain
VHEINIGALLETHGKEIGRVERVILDGVLFEASHLVIKLGGPLAARHVLMPVHWVTKSEHNRIGTNRGEAEVAALPNFETQHYTRLDQLDEEYLEHPRSKIKPSDWINYLVPFVAGSFGEPSSPQGVIVTEQLLSGSERIIKRGLAVESVDGHKIGEVHELLLSDADWRLSGVIIARGLVRRRPMRLPADWVAKIEQERILLNRSKQQIVDWERQQNE